MKADLRDVRIDQTLRVFRKGSLLRGTVETGVGGLDVRLSFSSDEPPERIDEVVRLAKASCFQHGALVEHVPVETTVTVNGVTLE